MGAGLPAIAVCHSTSMLPDTPLSRASPLPQGYGYARQIPGKKKPDLAKAFNRATALRSNKCKGRFDARKALKGLRQAT
ncbi:hypothetical protein DJ564_08595 [Pseudomonas sp. 31-12]|nr:hypothetical protein DJ564_08595 [Pseudomonas sp. 31-12]